MSHGYPHYPPGWHGTPAGPGPGGTSYPTTGDGAYLLSAAATGAAVGATGAAALALRDVRRGQLAWQQAAAGTLQAGLKAGVATAAAAAVGRMFWRHPVLSVAATLATGTAVMYALDGRQEGASDA